MTFCYIFFWSFPPNLLWAHLNVSFVFSRCSGSWSDGSPDLKRWCSPRPQRLEQGCSAWDQLDLHQQTFFLSSAAQSRALNSSKEKREWNIWSRKPGLKNIIIIIIWAQKSRNWTFRDLLGHYSGSGRDVCWFNLSLKNDTSVQSNRNILMQRNYEDMLFIKHRLQPKL